MKNLILSLSSVIFFALLETACYKSGPHSKKPWHPSNAYGMTLYDTDNSIRSKITIETLDLENRKFPIMFPTTVPSADSLDVVSFNLVSSTFFSMLFGNYFHNEDERHLQSVLRPYLMEADKKKKKGNVLIVNNIQFSTKTNGWTEFFRHYLIGPYYRTERFNVVAEIAEISPQALSRYLNGEKEEVEKKTESASPVANFKGMIFSVQGNTAVIVSPELRNLRAGNKLDILDRSGQKAGEGTVKSMFHTKAEISIMSGRAEKGFNVIRYGK